VSAPRAEKRDVHGWIALDKAAGKTSTGSVVAVRRLFQAKKAGHAGTLDPLATGVLPIALGEATKTVPFVMDGRKAYRFTVRWGSETDTDDAEGRVVSTSDIRPRPADIRAALPGFVGEIAQVPPRYSALKIEGERASRPNAARAPMCARWRAIWAGRSARSAMWRACGARASVRSPRATPSRSTSWPDFWRSAATRR
jgi:tRNA pseudouridine(55) synthase